MSIDEREDIELEVEDGTLYVEFWESTSAAANISAEAMTRRSEDVNIWEKIGNCKGYWTRGTHLDIVQGVLVYPAIRKDPKKNQATYS
jgi:predicted transcriptional regulator